MDPQLLAAVVVLVTALVGVVQWQIGRMQRTIDAQSTAHELCTWKLSVIIGFLQHAGMTVPDEMWATEIPKRRATDPPATPETPATAATPAATPPPAEATP